MIVVTWVRDGHNSLESLLCLFLSHPGSPPWLGYSTRVSPGSRFQLSGFSFKPLAPQLRIVNVRSGLTRVLIVPHLPPLCAPDPPGLPGTVGLSIVVVKIHLINVIR